MGETRNSMASQGLGQDQCGSRDDAGLVAAAALARGVIVQKNCEACGALISVRLADHKRGWGRFCDKSCGAAFRFGQRPRDVNKEHAKHGGWAAVAFQRLVAAGGAHPRAPRIKDQLGHGVKVKPIHHSPAKCRTCGVKIEQGERYCFDHEDFEDEGGWDGHKGHFA